MSNFGLKVSLPGYDVHTATPEECAVHSGYISPKVKVNQTPDHSGTYSFTCPGNVTPGTVYNILTVAHGYNYVPAAICHWSATTIAGYPQHGICPGIVGDFPPIKYIAYCDSTNFYIGLSKDAAATYDTTGMTASFRYYIFAESGI